jgi:hypothetical protein
MILKFVLVFCVVVFSCSAADNAGLTDAHIISGLQQITDLKRCATMNLQAFPFGSKLNTAARQHLTSLEREEKELITKFSNEGYYRHMRQRLAGRFYPSSILAYRMTLAPTKLPNPLAQIAIEYLYTWEPGQNMQVHLSANGDIDHITLKGAECRTHILSSRASRQCHDNNVGSFMFVPQEILHEIDQRRPNNLMFPILKQAFGRGALPTHATMRMRIPFYY